MKKALLMTYRFPPQGGGGVQRNLKYMKYLREYGWEPVVQTARNPFWPVIDQCLENDIPHGMHIYKTPTFEVERLEHNLRGVAGRVRQGRACSHMQTGASSPRTASEKPPSTKRASGTRGGLKHIGGALRTAVYGRLLIPDQYIAWAPGAILHGLWIVRREGVRLIYSSSPPNSLHFAAGWIARWLKLPWIADFRDPWTDGPRRQLSYVGNSGREALEKRAERWVVQNADQIVVTTSSLQERFIQKYDFLTADNVEIIPNGYDPDDFIPQNNDTRLLEKGKFHLTGTGNIEAMFPGEHLFRAIARVVAEDAAFARDFQLNLVGAKRGMYDALIQQLSLGDKVRYSDWVPHSRSVQYLRESQALLMCQIPEKSSGGEKLSGKCFEYLYMRKPILCLTVPGISADLLHESKAGTIVNPCDQKGIEHALRGLYARRNDPTSTNESVIARFDRRRLTERLALLFDRCVMKASRSLEGKHSPLGG